MVPDSFGVLLLGGFGRDIRLAFVDPILKSCNSDGYENRSQKNSEHDPEILSICPRWISHRHTPVP
jgi:hypothetical protein